MTVSSLTRSNSKMRITLSVSVVIWLAASPIKSAYADAISDYLCAHGLVNPAEYADCQSFTAEKRHRFEEDRWRKAQLRQELRRLINHASGGQTHAFILPESWNYQAIPQDPANPLNYWKVKLGQLLFHDTAFAVNGESVERAGTWSCATCHHAAAGFKAGIKQGIGEGGDGFGKDGSERVVAPEFDGSQWTPDVQAFTSPSILNSAYQDVMLWNGQFGNATNGTVNRGLAENILATPGTPKAENIRQLSGLETQAIAGLGVHRMLVDTPDSVLKTIRRYKRLYDLAFPFQGETLQNAGLALAAYERTVLANRAPFQRFLRGSPFALDMQELRGGIVFFGKGNCIACHRGPALSSAAGASEEEMFYAIGFADFDPTAGDIVGPVTDADKKGRGGFTQEQSDNYKFKIPQLYNLADADIFGHGGSFSSVREVINYKLRGIPQVVHGDGSYLDSRFTNPPQLNQQEIDDLVVFLENALYDPRLQRYQPWRVPSGRCFPAADMISKYDLNCENENYN